MYLHWKPPAMAMAMAMAKRKPEEVMLNSPPLSKFSELDAAAVMMAVNKEAIAAMNRQEEAEERKVDRISDLPVGILESILSRLPLKDMVKTSALSRRWRHLWTFTPLHIDEYHIRGVDSTAGMADEYDCDYCLIVQAMETIVSHHRGPIRSFNFAWPVATPVCDDHHSSNFIEILHQMMDAWAQVMARRGVKNVTMMKVLPPSLLKCPSLLTLELLDIGDLEREVTSLPPSLRELKLEVVNIRTPSMLHSLPRCVLACGSLSSLEVTEYSLREPFGVKMPSNLRELRLHRGSMTSNVLERVLATCKLLDILDLYECVRPDKLRISSKSLRKLRIHRINEYQDPVHLVVEDVPSLELLLFDELLTEQSRLSIVRAPKLRFLGRVNACAKSLQLEKTRFQDGSLIGLSAHIYNLKELSVRVSLNDAHQAKLLADLLRCFPCLESLDVEISEHSANCEVEDFWELESSSNCLDRHLKVVKLTGFSRQPDHLYFLGYLIRNARVLRSIAFLYRQESEIKWAETTRNELSLKNKASLDVEVISRKWYCDYPEPTNLSFLNG